VRFTRGVPISGSEALEPVMVRRLKRDLRQLGVEQFPERILCRLELRHADGAWQVEQERFSAEEQRREPVTTLASGLLGGAQEPALAELLSRYAALCAPEQGKGRLVFIKLQKRLLSSPEAFARTLEVHAQTLERQGGIKVKENKPQSDLTFDVDAYGEDDDTLAAEDDAAVAQASALLPSSNEEATALLKQMRALAHQARRVPDGKTRALLAWLRANLCPAIGVSADKSQRKWNERRVILFTEYADTKRYITELLTEAIAGSDRAEERILSMHGGMGDDARDEVQRAFNSPPREHPVRILVATDAAREGVNLQAHCADLFHLDVPWNPSRMEQRNGRIDRTLQPESEVRCHYFVYAQRSEDLVLDTLVRKIQNVRRELGSVGAVLMDEMESDLQDGISAGSADKLERVGNDVRGETAKKELEAGTRQQLDKLQAEILKAGQRLERSARALEVDPISLRGVVELGLRMSGADGLAEGPATDSGRQTFVLPTLDRSWDVTLDTLRPTRGRKEAFWEWRKKPPRHVTFEPLTTLTEQTEQLHLAHPLVRRILNRFVAQGYGAHDLSRVSAVVVPDEKVARVLAYARLIFFGHGAARLHDELVCVAAPWTPGEPVQPYKDLATSQRARDLTERALGSGQKAPAGRVSEQVLSHAPQLYFDERFKRGPGGPHVLLNRSCEFLGRQAALLTQARQRDQTVYRQRRPAPRFGVQHHP